MFQVVRRLSSPARGLVLSAERTFFGVKGAGDAAKASSASSSEGSVTTGENGSSQSVTFKLRPFKTHIIDPPEHTTTSNAEELRNYFTDMYRMRRMEMELDSMYQRSLVRGFCHLYNGQEAVAVGMEAAITRDDCIITAYRNHCQQLARGGTVDSIMAELSGKFSGCSKGKGGSMHLYLKENNYYGGHGIVGAQVPLGAGLAFAQKYKGNRAVAITMFGDGAANQGQLYEAINMSALWRLPCIFVCENNQYGMGTSTNRAAALRAFYTRGHYIPGICIDGMDVLAVREGMKFAKKVALEEGPIYVEMDTYRYKGHSISDQGLSYRSADEIKGVQTGRDPIDLVKKRLIDNGWATAEELKAIEKDIRKEIDRASKSAEVAEQPPAGELFHDVYLGESPRIRGTLDTNGNMA